MYTFLLVSESNTYIRLWQVWKSSMPIIIVLLFIGMPGEIDSSLRSSPFGRLRRLSSRYALLGSNLSLPFIRPA